MKTIKLLSTICFILACFTSHSQNKKFTFGIELGPTRGTLHGNEILKKSKAMIGFKLGATVQYRINDRFSIVSGIGFERKGAIFKGHIQDSLMLFRPIEEHHNFHYIILPLLAKVQFGKKNNFFINGGGYAGHLTARHIITETQNGPKKKENNMQYLKTYDFGLTLGLGMIIPFKRCNFNVELRNNFGMYNISDVPVINNGTIKTNSTVLLVGIPLN